MTILFHITLLQENIENCKCVYILFGYFFTDFSTTPSPFSTPSSSSTANNADGRPSVIGWTDMRHRGDGRDGDTSASSTGLVITAPFS